VETLSKQKEQSLEKEAQLSTEAIKMNAKITNSKHIINNLK